MPRINLLGMKFSSLTVIGSAEDSDFKSRWLCRCDCGNELIVFGYNLKSGHSNRCRPCNNIKAITATSIHNKSKTRIYATYQCMRARCEYPKNERFKCYGGRGIRVCKEWRNSAKAFFDWAAANGYADELTIDRIDNNGDYCPENCRWITMKEQANNKQTTHWIDFNGERKNISEWAKSLGLKYATLQRRLAAGWPIEKALTSTNYNERGVI